MSCIIPNWPAPSHIKAFTTTKQGWCGGYEKKIDPNEIQQLVDLYHLPTKPIWLNQRHTTIVLPAAEETRSQIGDGLYSDKKNHICLIETADCLPILITDTSGSFVAAIHAGWKGLANGIIEETQAILPHSSNVLAWLGPGIGPTHFEVGNDVYEVFTKTSEASRAAFRFKHENKWLADLYQLATIRLNACGITAVYGGEFCTYSDEKHFYSYRRNPGELGRMATLIWIQS